MKTILHIFNLLYLSRRRGFGLKFDKTNVNLSQIHLKTYSRTLSNHFDNQNLKIMILRLAINHIVLIWLPTIFFYLFSSLKEIWLFLLRKTLIKKLQKKKHEIIKTQTPSNRSWKSLSIKKNFWLVQSKFLLWCFFFFFFLIIESETFILNLETLFLQQ